MHCGLRQAQIACQGNVMRLDSPYMQDIETQVLDYYSRYWPSMSVYYRVDYRVAIMWDSNMFLRWILKTYCLNELLHRAKHQPLSLYTTLPPWYLAR